MSFNNTPVYTNIPIYCDGAQPQQFPTAIPVCIGLLEKYHFKNTLMKLNMHFDIELLDNNYGHQES